MTRRTFWQSGPAVLMAFSVCSGQSKKSKTPKPPDATIESIRIRREEDAITIDGKVKNSGLKPIAGMMLLFEFLGPNKESLTIQNGALDSEMLTPGDEAEFRMQVKAPARAVEVKVEAQDKDHRDLRMERNGPFPIE